MRKRRIPQARPIPRSSWAIPVSEEQRQEERELMRDWAAYGTYLERLGFERVRSVESQNHQSLAGKYSGKEVETHELWQHRAGVVLHTHSYTSGGYTKQDGTVEPVRKQLGSANIHTRIDLGVGRENTHRAACAISGSGGTDPQLDGSSIRNISDIFHSNTGTLSRWLENIQQYGKFLPFDQWNTSTMRDSMYLPNELVYPLTELDEDVSVSDGRVHFDHHEALVAMCDTLPEGLDQVVRDLAGERGSAKNDGRRWMDVEIGIDQFSEILSMGKKRWRDSLDVELLTHWQEVALGEHGEDPSTWRMEETGSAGLTLPVALICARRETGAGTRLLAAMDAASDETLRRWATKPDAGGYTLALHAVNRLFCDRGMIDRAPQDTLCQDVFTKLHERLGKAGVVLETDKRSFLGLATQYVAKRESHHIDPRHIDQCLADFNQIVDLVDGWGLDWDQSLKWRDYPNTVMKEGMPHFFDLERAPEEQDLLDAMAGRAMIDQQETLLGRVRKKRLDALIENLPGAPERRHKM